MENKGSERTLRPRFNSMQLKSANESSKAIILVRKMLDCADLTPSVRRRQH